MSPDSDPLSHGRIVEQPWRLQRRVVTETGRATFRSMPPVVRLRILGRLKKLTADAEAEITRVSALAL
jgi:hypothetical protein